MEDKRDALTGGYCLLNSAGREKLGKLAELPIREYLNH
jgi:hypothetical protein